MAAALEVALLTLGSLLLAVALALVAASLAPVDVHVEAEAGTASPTRAALHLRWLHGLVAFSAPSGEPTPANAQVAPRARPAARRRVSTSPGRRWRVLRSPGLIPRLGQLLRELLSIARPRRVALEARFGFDDPAETAALWGAILAVDGALTRTDGSARLVRVRLEPVFDEAIAWVHVDADFRARPARVMWALARFVCSPLVLRLMWRAARA